MNRSKDVSTFLPWPKMNYFLQDELLMWEKWFLSPEKYIIFILKLHIQKDQSILKRIPG